MSRFPMIDEVEAMTGEEIIHMLDELECEVDSIAESKFDRTCDLIRDLTTHFIFQENALCPILGRASGRRSRRTMKKRRR